MNSAWITVRTAAKIMGISHNTLRALIRENEISVLGKVDGRIVVLDRAYIEREATKYRGKRVSRTAA